MTRYARVLTALAIALPYTGGVSQEPPLTEARQAAIRAEVIKSMGAMIAAEERLDAAAVWAFHADVPGYFWADTDGKLYDFSGTKQAWAEYYASCAHLKFTTRRQEVLVLGPDTAWYLWHGAADVTQKDGTSTRVDPWTARYLWRHIGGAWRIVGGQESALPPRPVPLSAQHPKAR